MFFPPSLTSLPLAAVAEPRLKQAVGTSAARNGSKPFNGEDTKGKQLLKPPPPTLTQKRPKPSNPPPHTHTSAPLLAPGTQAVPGGALPAGAVWNESGIQWLVG